MLKNTCFHLNYNMRPPCIPVSLHMKRCWWNGDVLASVCCGWQWVRTVNRQQLAYVAFVLPSPAVSEEANAKMTGAAAGVALRMVVVVFCVCCCWSVCCVLAFLLPLLSAFLHRCAAVCKGVLSSWGGFMRGLLTILRWYPEPSCPACTRPWT